MSSKYTLGLYDHKKMQIIAFHERCMTCIVWFMSKRFHPFQKKKETRKFWITQHKFKKLSGLDPQFYWKQNTIACAAAITFTKYLRTATVIFFFYKSYIFSSFTIEQVDSFKSPVLSGQVSQLFHANVLFLYTLKTSENQNGQTHANSSLDFSSECVWSFWFSDVFSGYINGTLM